MNAAAAARTAALNTLWSAAIIEELVRHGVDTFAVAPGSRSTPLVAAIARHPRAHGEVLTDERAAAFFALGHARGCGRPAALVTTSGSAPAHAYPAVLEAEADGVPLLVLSADRPPELRGTGANQTVDQVGLFGGHVRWHQDVPCPTEDIAVTEVIAWAADAVRRALDPPGPVHLNLMFRKPLEPVAGVTPAAALWPAAARPRKRWSRAVRGVSGPDAAELAGLLEAAERGLVVVGGLAHEADRAAARRLVARLGWPVYADLASGLRLGAEAPV
ncbi:MAG: 2-succinyl-5-enolpyruvyl-6-hydroxy-3-cyclohexene-1-carboxylic-acid synthase, partial [Deltaproteobacteria bacterium HGW-Deltaproteobacteria-14]